jgi:predicted ATP-grasp superfamily ATP-dependent carboligase/LmbE family N-acetylglucosaminyl deacetylase
MSPASRNHTRLDAGTAAPPGVACVVGMSGATGLAVVRALAHGGVTCHAVHVDACAAGLASRLATPHVSPDWRADPEEFVAYLLSLAASRLGAAPASLFVTDDAAVTAVWEAREPLRAAGLRPAFAFAGSPLEVLDKRTQIAAARRAGVEHPWTEWGAAEDLLERVDAFRYPLLVKPALSHVGVRRIGAKALRCASAAELAEALERTAGFDVLVQDFVPGGDDQLYTCGLWRGGRQHLAFTGRKLKQHPPTLGISRLSEAVEVPEIVAGSMRLLEELGYEGVAQVEYKRDARDGAYRLMEVNVRPWTWIGLATACGVNLPLRAHAWALAEGSEGEGAASTSGDAAPRPPDLAQTPGRWVWLLPEIIHTVRDLAHGRPPDPAQWRGLRAEAFFARDDPGPLLAELVAPVRSRVARVRGGVRTVKRSVRHALRGPAFAINLAVAVSSEVAARRAGRAGPALGLPPGDRVLVLAPHPDDETIMCGATLSASRRRGDAVRIVAVTSGTATSEPGVLDDVAAAGPAGRARAAATLGVDDVVFWELPDRGLAGERDRLAGLIAAMLEEFAPTDVYAPFPYDPHADHSATAAALADALARAPRHGTNMHCGFVLAAPDPAWIGRVVPATAGDWAAKLQAVHDYASRDASVFARPQQLARLAPRRLLRAAEQFVELPAAAFVDVVASLQAEGLTVPAYPARSHPLFVALEAAATREQRRRIGALLAQARARLG